jgi:colanic acid biosynthesis glycosyl transferase WcaI
LDTKKRVLVCGINFYPELTGIGKYTAEMVNWMVNHDIACTVITAYPYYPYWEIQKPYKNYLFKKEVSHNGNLIVYRCPLYIPRNPSGFKRIVHEATFFMSAFVVLLLQLFKKTHDFVFTISPPFHLGFLALFYRLFKKTKVTYHIQDLQVDAAKELNMIKSDAFISLMMQFEKFIIKESDFVSSISDGMINKIKLKDNRPVLKFPNWVDTEFFYPIDDKQNLKQQWGYKEDDYIILYSGNLGEKQGLNIIIQLAERFAGNQNIKFVICGSGSYKATLLKLAEDSRLDNVDFLPLQPPEVFNKFLNMADMHLIIQRKEASDLVLPSKLANILAVGGLLLATANENTSLYNTIHENKIGLIAEPEDLDSLEQVILENMQSDNTAISKRAITYANQHLSLDKLLANFIDHVTSKKSDRK